MFPTILKLGPVSLRSWGLLLAIAFITGIWLACRRARAKRLNPQKMVDLAVVIIIAAVIGGRLAFVVTHIPEFRHSPGEIFAIWRGGMAFYGGAVLAFAAGVAYLKRQKLDVWLVADVVAPSLALGLFIGRIGCLLNGCCFGEPTDLPWAIVFPDGSYAEQVYGAGVRVHPTQIYSSLAGLTMFLLLLRTEKLWKFSGALFWEFVVMYSFWRIYVDVLRYCEPSSLCRIDGISLAVSQLVSMGLIVAGVTMLAVLYKRSRTLPPRRSRNG